MSMKRFEYVLVLADKGSFSDAAAALNISQPSLSQYIKRIESDLGVTLFDRLSGEVRLTEAGQVYLDACKKIMDTERQMKDKFSDLSSFNTGSVVVGIAPTRCRYLMPEAVRRFAEIYPGMHIVIEERFLDSLLEDAEHGTFDLFVATLPVDEKKFSYELMMKEEVILAVPVDLPVYEKLRQSARSRQDKLYPAVDIRLTHGAPYVCLSDTQATQILLSSFAEELDFEVKTAVRCMCIDTQYSMVKSGAGCALIPSSVAKYSASASVAYFSLIQPTREREMAVIYRKDQYLSKAVLALKNILISL